MKRTKSEPYIGITDFTSSAQVRRILAIPQEKLMDPKMDHLLGVGVMMSYKTLHGMETKWANVFPAKEEIAEIFINHPGVYNVLHYADYDNVSTSEDFAKAFSYAGPNVHAMQFDMIWPAAADIRKGLGRSRKRQHEVKVILQVGRQAMEVLGNDIDRIIGALADYREQDCLDYVLLDKSGGEGREMDSELLLSYYRAVRAKFKWDELGIIVAGGLGPSSVQRLLAPFRRDNSYLDISIDAQGRLRRSGSALYPLNLSMAAEYYEKAVQFFGWA